MLRTLLAGIGVIAIITVSAAGLNAYGGYRDPDAQVVRLRVSPAGLDLTTREGLDLLDGRIKRAIDRICDNGVGYAYGGSDRQCRDDAWAGTRPQVTRAIARSEDRRRFESRRGFAGDPVSADLDRQPRGVRTALYQALDQAIRTGQDTPWRTWREDGWIAVNRPAVFDGLTCSTVSVIRQGPDGQADDQVVTQGLWCLSPDGSTGPLPTY